MKQYISIIVLSLTALLLILTNLSLQEEAQAATAIKDRDYQLVTARLQDGSEGLYVTDNRTGLMAILAFDPASRTVVPRAVRPVSDAFSR